MAISPSSVLGFNSPLQAKYQYASSSSVGASAPKATEFTYPYVMFGSSRLVNKKPWSMRISVANKDQLAADSAVDKSLGSSETSPSEGRLSTANAASSDSAPGTSKSDTESQTPEVPNGSSISSTPEKETTSSPDSQSKPRRSPLTARERLKAARVFNRYAETKAPKSEMGSKVLAALRESERGGKRRSGLPEAPTNLFDDSKRGMPKQGLTFSFPGGNDLFYILLSFVLISTLMFTTTYVVWKVGAIHFNEY